MPRDLMAEDNLRHAQAKTDRLTWELSDARMEITTLKATQAELVKALETILPLYVRLSGLQADGFWNADAELPVIAARAALAKAKQP